MVMPVKQPLCPGSCGSRTYTIFALPEARGALAAGATTRSADPNQTQISCVNSREVGKPDKSSSNTRATGKVPSPKSTLTVTAFTRTLRLVPSCRRLAQPSDSLPSVFSVYRGLDSVNILRSASVLLPSWGREKIMPETTYE